MDIKVEFDEKGLNKILETLIVNSIRKGLQKQILRNTSIVREANRSNIVFPALISDDTPFDTANDIIKHAEKKMAIAIKTLLNRDIKNAKDVNIRTMINELPIFNMMGGDTEPTGSQIVGGAYNVSAQVDSVRGNNKIIKLTEEQSRQMDIRIQELNAKRDELDLAIKEYEKKSFPDNKTKADYVLSTLIPLGRILIRDILTIFALFGAGIVIGTIFGAGGVGITIAYLVGLCASVYINIKDAADFLDFVNKLVELIDYTRGTKYRFTSWNTFLKDVKSFLNPKLAENVQNKDGKFFIIDKEGKNIGKEEGYEKEEDAKKDLAEKAQLVQTVEEVEIKFYENDIQNDLSEGHNDLEGDSYEVQPDMDGPSDEYTIAVATPDGVQVNETSLALDAIIEAVTAEIDEELETVYDANKPETDLPSFPKSDDDFFKNEIKTDLDWGEENKPINELDSHPDMVDDYFGTKVSNTLTEANESAVRVEGKGLPTTIMVEVAYVTGKEEIKNFTFEISVQCVPHYIPKNSFMSKIITYDPHRLYKDYVAVTNGEKSFIRDFLLDLASLKQQAKDATNIKSILTELDRLRKVSDMGVNIYPFTIIVMSKAMRNDLLMSGIDVSNVRRWGELTKKFFAFATYCYDDIRDMVEVLYDGDSQWQLYQSSDIGRDISKYEKELKQLIQFNAR